VTTANKVEDFKFTFEVSIIEHLGLNLYSEVYAALSELIANSYDAEATSVSVSLPIGIELGHANQQIVITDNGHGMTYEECRDKYLRIGRNRRSSSRKSKNGKRRVIGRKGIGKLAGFGVADSLHVCTISNGRLTEFELRLPDIRVAPAVRPEDSNDKGKDAEDVAREYHPDVVHKDLPTDEENGTTVILSDLRDLDAVDYDEFMQRLARKFAVFGDDFEVTVQKAGSADTRVVKKFDIDCQFRFPENGWARETIETPSGEREVQYWIGFTRATIKNDAVRGIGIIATGKSVQEPFDFRLSGGVTGQFGLQYMTGEVHADWLDEGAIDVIASDRSSVRWSNPDASKLLQWGQAKLRELLPKWAELRASSTIKEVTERDPEIQNEIEAYKGEARKELEQVVDRVVSVISHVSTERAKEVVGSIVTSYRHAHVQQVLSKIMDSSSGLELFGQALAEWDLIEAVLTYQELSAKLTSIITLRTLILGRATEVRSKSGDLSLHEHLAEHPWLIDPMFKDMESEREIDKFVLAKYGEDPGKDRKRADFIVVYDSGRVRIVEIKSAKSPVDERGLTNLMQYHHRIKTNERKQSRPRPVQTLLIYNGGVTAGGEALLDTIERDQEFEVITWTELLDRNETIYKRLRTGLENVTASIINVTKTTESSRNQSFLQLWRRRFGICQSRFRFRPPG